MPNLVLDRDRATLSAHAVRAPRCRAVVLWIDWYPYHVARFEGLQAAFGCSGEVRGIEFVGGIGVHAGLKFREEIPRHLPVETLLPTGNWRRASKLRLAVAVWRRLSRLDPEVVLVPGYATLPALAAAAWAKAHRRISVLMTESTQEDHPRKRSKERAKSMLIRSLFDWAVTGGAAHVRYLTALGFPRDRTARFYDVVDNDGLRERTIELRRSSAATSYGLPARYFLFVGRLAREKNVAALLQAWLGYRRGGGTWPLVLAGDGPEAAALRGLTAPSPFAADVHFAGHKSSRELLPFFSFAGCLVLPSVREPWGLVVNEAMAAGLPVIVSNRCGCAEDLVESGGNGLLFNPEHPGELTACLHRMEQASAEQLGRMGSFSYQRITDYSPKNFGREIAAIADFAVEGATTHAGNHAPREMPG